MPNKNPSNQWKPGQSGGYADFLRKLKAEDAKDGGTRYEDYLRKNRQKKAMRKAMETVVLEQQNKWLSQLNNAAAMLLQKAIEEQDHNAFIAVWDRIIGKPRDEIDVSGDLPLPFHSDFPEPTKLSNDFEGFGQDADDEETNEDDNLLEQIDEDLKDDDK